MEERMVGSSYSSGSGGYVPYSGSALTDYSYGNGGGAMGSCLFGFTNYIGSGSNGVAIFYFPNL